MLFRSLQLKFSGLAPKQQFSVKVNGRLLQTDAVDATGTLVCNVELPPAPSMGGKGIDRVA